MATEAGIMEPTTRLHDRDTGHTGHISLNDHERTMTGCGVRDAREYLF